MEVDRIMAQDNKHGKTQNTRDKVADGLSSRWSYANEIISYARAKEPEGNWSNTQLITFEKKKYSSPELVKILPYYRFIIAVRLLFLACLEGIQEAFAGAALVLRGLRVGESSAIILGDIEYNGSIARCYVDKQVESKGKITNRLKNESSYRYVFIFGLLLDIVEMRKKQLREQGYSNEEINRSYLGSSYEDPTVPIDKTKVSAFLKSILILSGCENEDLRTVERDVFGEKGDDCDHDLSAHLFRRNFATYALNGGMSLQEVDALLGHENQKNKKIDYAGWDNAAVIVGKLNRCMNLGSITSRPNPSFLPVYLSNMSVIADGNKEYHFLVDRDGEIEGSFFTLEANDPIEIIVDGCEIDIPIMVQTSVDNIEDRKSRTVLSIIPSAEEIEQWIRIADETWEKSELGGGLINEK